MTKSQLEDADQQPTLLNATSNEHKALSELQSNFDIVIREADKGSAIIIMNVDFYRENVLKQLNNNKYTLSPRSIEDTTKLLIRKRTQLIKNFNTYLLPEEQKFIIGHEHNLAHIYLNPKIHKSQTIISEINKDNAEIIQLNEPNDLPFRPITSGTRCPLKNLATLLNKLLAPFSQKVGSYVKDTWHVLSKLPKKCQKKTELISFDVKDLYTNIDNDLGRIAITYYVNKYPELCHDRLNKEFVLSSLELLQSNIYFQFEEKVYQQINGCAMGKDYGPNYATLSVGFLEETKLYPEIRRIFPTQTAEDIIKNYIRYQDDCLTFNQSQFDTNQLFELFNNLHPGLEFTIEKSHSQLPFLDILLQIKDKKIITSMYHKPTDSFNYLNFASNHPAHTKRNIPYSLARRIRGIVSTKLDRIKSYLELRLRLLVKAYPDNLIKNAILKAESQSRDSIINPITTNLSTTVNLTPNTLTLVTTHHNILDNIGHTFITLAKDSKVDSLKQHKMIHALRQPPNLKLKLMRTNNYRSSIFEVKSCNRSNCGLCTIYKNIITATSYTLKNKMTIKPNANFDCNSTNLIYCIICPNCGGHYIGQTECLRNRMNLHRSHSSPGNEDAPLKINQHLQTCARGRFLVIPFFKVRRFHQIAREGWEQHFIEIFKPSLQGQQYHR